MDYQDEVYHKGLSFLFGKEKVNEDEFRSQLKEEFGNTGYKIFNELNQKGWIESQSLLNVRISRKGILYYENIRKKALEESKKKKYDNKVYVVAVIGAVAATVAAWPVIHDAYCRIVTFFRK